MKQREKSRLSPLLFLNLVCRLFPLFGLFNLSYFSQTLSHSPEARAKSVVINVAINITLLGFRYRKFKPRQSLFKLACTPETVANHMQALAKTCVINPAMHITLLGFHHCTFIPL